LTGTGLAPNRQREAVSDNLCSELGYVGHSESDVIESRSARRSRGWLFAQEKIDVRKADHVGVANFDRRSTPRVDPEFLVGFNAGNVEMVVTCDDGRVFV